MGVVVVWGSGSIFTGVGWPKMVFRYSAKCFVISLSSSINFSWWWKSVLFLFCCFGQLKLFSSFQCFDTELLKPSKALKLVWRFVDFSLAISTFIFLFSMLKILRSCSECVLIRRRLSFLFSFICFRRVSGTLMIEKGLFLMVIVLVEVSNALASEFFSVSAARSNSEVVAIVVGMSGGFSSRVRVKSVQLVLRKVIISRVREKSLMVVSVGWWSLMWSGRTLKLSL